MYRIHISPQLNQYTPFALSLSSVTLKPDTFDPVARVSAYHRSRGCFFPGNNFFRGNRNFDISVAFTEAFNAVFSVALIEAFSAVFASCLGQHLNKRGLDMRNSC